MSQDKVDKKKYVKKHRKEIERKRKAKTILVVICVCLIIGAAIGIPIGVNAYKNMPKIIGDATLKSFVANYIDEHYQEEIALCEKIGKDFEEQADENAVSSDEDLDLQDYIETEGDMDVDLEYQDEDGNVISEDEAMEILNEGADSDENAKDDSSADEE